MLPAPSSLSRPSGDVARRHVSGEPGGWWLALRVFAGSTLASGIGCSVPALVPANQAADYAELVGKAASVELGQRFDDVATYLPPEGGTARLGRADITAYLRAALAHIGNARLEVVSSEVVERTDDEHAVVRHRYRLTGPHPQELVASEHWRWAQEEWRIVFARWEVVRPEHLRELGALCSVDAECRGFARCNGGSCQVAR